MTVRFEANAEPIPGYRLLDRLGAGGFGEVWRCEAPGGIFKAMKIIFGDLRSNDNDLVRYAEQELKAIKRVQTVRHPYLLSIDRWDIVEGRLCIVMELADCNLWDRFRECRGKGLAGIPRDELMVYMQEAAEVLDLMNDRFQLQHLDIKPQNLFLLLNHVKVADFGQVKDLEGHLASVTGGITPVYAAPETFDGFVSRYCDQYSLACVYQELLTGQRPFDGTSMQQLLMQHLQMPPNLLPCPSADRPALTRALAKKPEDRFPSVSAMVRALKDGSPPTVRAVSPQDMVPTPPTIGPQARSDVVLAPPHAGGSSLLIGGGLGTTPPPAAPAETMPPRPAPATRTGPGPVRPAVVVGLGQTGLRVLQRLRKQLADRFGGVDRTPTVRLLYIDTDPDTLAAAVTDSAGGGTALRPEEVFPARLNRAAHYLKPRLNGKSLTEGWFDQQLLYKLPRTPTTTGLRTLGRLAFCDHYRPILLKLQAGLDAATSDEALADTLANTGLELRTNRPRVYVVAGLGGGTGGGMFVDMAYAARSRLRQMGYTDPDVTGLLLLPPDGPTDEVGAQTQANVYAAITELNHFTRPGNGFQASYDDRASSYRDPFPPFTQTVVLPGPATPSVPLTPVGSTHRSGAMTNSGVLRPRPTRPGSGVHTVLPGSGSHPVVAASDLTPKGQDPYLQAAEFVAADLFTAVGRAADENRGPPPPWAGPVAVRTFGLVKFDWPRAEVVGRTAKVVAGVVLDHWVSPNFGRVRELIPGWATHLAAQLRIDPDGLTGVLTTAADTAAGSTVEQYLLAATEHLVPKGSWRAKLPEPAALAEAFAHVERLFGPPIGTVARMPTAVEEAMRVAAFDLMEECQSQMPSAVTTLVDDPTYRMAGAEEAARHLLGGFDRGMAQLVARAEESEAISRSNYELLAAYVHGRGRGKTPAPADLGQALRSYPRAQFDSLLARRAVKVYEHMKLVAAAVLQEVAGCRQRVESFRRGLIGELDHPAPPPGPRQVLPVGCPTIEEAAQKFLSVLTDDDLTELEHRVQAGVEAKLGGLYQACLNSAGGTEQLLRVLRDEVRTYLDARLGSVDLAAMIASAHGGSAGTAMLIGRGMKDATPELVGPGPWAKSAVAVIAAPPGPSGDAFRRAVDKASPPEVAVLPVDAGDEVMIYREIPHLPLAVLPQCGPAWATAYQTVEMSATSAHTRVDIPEWVGVDAD